MVAVWRLHGEHIDGMQWGLFTVLTLCLACYTDGELSFLVDGWRSALSVKEQARSCEQRVEACYNSYRDMALRRIHNLMPFSADLYRALSCSYLWLSLGLL